MSASVSEVVERAASASAGMRSAGREARARWLRTIADDLDAAAPGLIEIAIDETGLTAPRLTGEVARTTSQLRLFAAAILEGSYLEATIDHADPQATPPIPDLRRMLIPIGPVAVYAASNFPFAFSIAGGDTASALAAGSPVIVKAHPGHPETSQRTAEVVRSALARAGAPEGAFGVVEGFDAGLELIDDPRVRAAAFTGSLAGGRALADRAAARPEPIPFFGELGSVNPVVVTEGADGTRGRELAEGLAASFTLGAGQFCTKPGIVFVPDESELESALVPAVPTDVQPMLTPGIGTAFGSGLAGLIAVDGVDVLRASAGAGDPAVLAVAAERFIENAEVLGREVFGPVTLLVRYRSAQELHAALRVTEGSLTGTLHHEEGEDVAETVGLLAERCGRLLFQGWPTGVAVSWAQHHGGPWPATNSQHTSVGVSALRRFLRPVAYQSAPASLVPEELREGNPSHLPRRVDGVLRIP